MNNHFDQLVSVLDDYPGSMDALSLHGFLTALAIGPDEALEKPWLREILNSPPGTALPENIEALGFHMMASLEQILGELTEERFHPRIKTPDKDNEAVKAWCRGFQQAVLLAESEWEAFHDRCPDAALKGITIAAILRPELAEAMFGIPQNQHDLFVAEQAPLLGSTMEAYYQAFTEIVFDEIADIDLEPPTMEELPRFSEEELTSKSNDELLHLLSIFDDSLPHVVILESIRREAPMVEKLNHYLADDKHWDEEQEFGEDSWWTRLHAIMILGGISGEKAGQSLISAFSRMPDYGDDPLWEWLAEYWPALFRNKPEGIHQMLHAMAENTSLDWYIRHHATNCVLAHAASKNQEALEQALDWLAGLIAAEDEDEEFRYMEGGTLLDFAPERHRPLLEKLADLQEDLGLGTIFLRSDINRAFKEGKNRPEWERFDNPWEFYDPEEILQRQQRWHSETAAHYSADEDEAYGEKEATWPNYHSSPVETYTREQPKVGRNEPCPCGSGKKYKKCCLQ